MNYYKNSASFGKQIAEVEEILNRTKPITDRTSKSILITLINSPDIDEDMLDEILRICKKKEDPYFILLEAARVSLYMYKKFLGVSICCARLIPNTGRLSSDVALYVLELEQTRRSQNEPAILRTLVYSNRLVDYYIENKLPVDGDIVVEELCKYTDRNKIERIDRLGISVDSYVRYAVRADNIEIFEHKCYGKVEDKILLAACAYLSMLSMKPTKTSKCFAKVWENEEDRERCEDFESTTTFLYRIMPETDILEASSRYAHHPEIISTLVKLRGEKFDTSFLLKYMGIFKLEHIFGIKLRLISHHLDRTKARGVPLKSRNIVDFHISDEIIDCAVERDCLDMLELYLIRINEIRYTLLLKAFRSKSEKCKVHILKKLQEKSITIDDMLRCLEKADDYSFTQQCHWFGLFTLDVVPRHKEKYTEFRRAYIDIVNCFYTA